jgi:hypothetical protein
MPDAESRPHHPDRPAESRPPHPPPHPHCPTCNVPMWLTNVQLGEIADHQRFECQVCHGTVKRTVPHEKNV